MDLEAGDADECSSLQKPTSLFLRRSNNRMMDKITNTVGNDRKLVKSLSTEDNITHHSAQDVVEVVNEVSKKDDVADCVSVDESCAMFGQIIDNDDENWDIFSDATSWESSFPKGIFSATDSVGTGALSDSDEANLPRDWKKVFDSGGDYYWNVRTGKTQINSPVSADNSVMSPGESGCVESREGHMFVVRSLGWLPMDSDSLKPDISSAAVNACIRHLSNNRARLMDGIGVWGEGKDLMLQLNEDQLKIVDPSKDTLLQSQPIKQIRLWGVGRDNSFDFAYVVRSPATKLYQCHVFRCDTPAPAIAKQVHSMCANLVRKKKLLKQSKAENCASANDELPVATTEPGRSFNAQYVGFTKVDEATGILTVKQAISDLTVNCDIDKLINVTVSVSASELVVQEADGRKIVNCRMRFLSFMGIGDNVEYFGFISVLSNQPACYVLRCEPNAAKLAVAVQEACMLRYQKAIDSKPCHTPNAEPKRSKSFKNKVAKMFSGFRRSGS